MRSASTDINVCISPSENPDRLAVFTHKHCIPENQHVWYTLRSILYTNITCCLIITSSLFHMIYLPVDDTHYTRPELQFKLWKSKRVLCIKKRPTIHESYIRSSYWSIVTLSNTISILYLLKDRCEAQGDSQGISNWTSWTWVSNISSVIILYLYIPNLYEES